MSVAFRREGDEEHLEPKFEIPIPPGPNLVTPRGLALIGERVIALEAQLARETDEERIKVAIEQFWRESTHPHKTRFDIVHSELAQNSAKYFGTNPPYPLSSATSLGKIKKVIANIRRQQKVTATSTP